MSKWKCEICGAEFENFHAQGFDNKIYCPLCYFKKENQELKKLLDYALKLLSDYNTPCDIGGFMDKHSDYCETNCGMDEEVFKKCWLIYIKDKLKEVE